MHSCVVRGVRKEDEAAHVARQRSRAAVHEPLVAGSPLLLATPPDGQRSQRIKREDAAVEGSSSAAQNPRPHAICPRRASATGRASSMTSAKRSGVMGHLQNAKSASSASGRPPSGGSLQAK